MTDLEKLVNCWLVNYPEVCHLHGWSDNIVLRWFQWQVLSEDTYNGDYVDDGDNGDDDDCDVGDDGDEIME